MHCCEVSPGDAFSLIVGNTEPLLQVKYVITLDTDTQLPRDSARQLVGAMAHPLNWPQFDRPRFSAHADPAHADRPKPVAPRHVVTTGYGILQPRIAVSLPETRRSPYARLYSGEPGLDPYTRTVSDVYQDAFGEGSFIGKGIYDVDAFESALANRFPDNRILSHDLLEGCLARSGLLSDVELYEQFPSRYSADVARRHRWIRGDWQLVGWLRRRVPMPDGRRVPNPLSWLSQWKIFDNLRRSLVPASLLLMLLVGWAALPHPWLWTAVVFAVLLLPALATALTDLLRKPNEAPIEQHLVAVARTAQVQFAQSLLALAWLPYEAFYSVDAIVRTLWRTLISHRRLLEWKPSSIVERQLEESHSSRLGRGLSNDVDRTGDRRVDVDGDAGNERLGVEDCRADSVAVAGVARAGVVGQPAARAAQRRSVGRSNTVSAPAGAQDVGIFRDLRQCGRKLAAARQCAAEKRRRHRASHVADQHGACPACRLDGTRFGLSDGRTVRRAHDERAARDAGAGASSRPFFQLVRHSHARAADAQIHFDRRQRQPCGRVC